MASEVWISEYDPEHRSVYKALQHWRYKEPYGEPFAAWMERNHRCYVVVMGDDFQISIPTIYFLTPADKTLFLLKWS